MRLFGLLWFTLSVPLTRQAHVLMRGGWNAVRSWQPAEH